MCVADRIAEAYDMARHSPDESNTNGAVIYSGGFLSSGYNHFPEGVPPTQQRPEKYERIVHAEADACLKLAHCSFSVDEDTVMYAPWATCKNCALCLLSSGIPKLVIHYERCLAFMQTRGNQDEDSLQDWQPDIDESSQWLKDGGCEIEVYSGPVDFQETILINGRPWSPKELCFAD